MDMSIFNNLIEEFVIIDGNTKNNHFYNNLFNNKNVLSIDLNLFFEFFVFINFSKISFEILYRYFKPTYTSGPG